MIKLQQRAYREIIETVTYFPDVHTLGDLEPSTRVITRTAEAIGLGLADYSHSLTLPRPTDARLIVTRICARLNIQGTVIGTPNLRCRVYVDAQAPANMLFDVTVGTTIDFAAAVDTHSGALATIFGLLSDGLPHTFHFFLWDPSYVATTHQYTVSVAQLWEAVGTCVTAEPVIVLDILHRGLMAFASRVLRIGTGTPSIRLGTRSPSLRWEALLPTATGHNAAFTVPLVLANDNSLRVMGTVATDLNYMSLIEANLRSEQ